MHNYSTELQHYREVIPKYDHTVRMDVPMAKLIKKTQNIQIDAFISIAGHKWYVIHKAESVTPFSDKYDIDIKIAFLYGFIPNLVLQGVKLIMDYWTVANEERQCCEFNYDTVSHISMLSTLEQCLCCNTRLMYWKLLLLPCTGCTYEAYWRSHTSVLVRKHNIHIRPCKGK